MAKVLKLVLTPNWGKSLYFNGDSGTPLVAVVHMPGNTDPLLIGKNNSVELFQGNTDELCFWDTT